MFNLRVGNLLVRNDKRSELSELNDLMGFGLYIHHIDEEVVKTYVAYPAGRSGRVNFANNPEVLEQYFETTTVGLVEKPQNLEFDQEDWILLCLLFQRNSPAKMSRAVEYISEEISRRRYNILLNIARGNADSNGGQ